MEELLKEYGWEGVAIYFLLKYGYMGWKKYFSGEWYSWKDIRNQQDRQQEYLKSMEIKVNEHLEKATEETIVSAKMSVRLDNHDEMIHELKETSKKLFDLIAEIKNMLIQRNT